MKKDAQGPVLMALFGLTALLSGTAAHAQEIAIPKTIKIIVPFSSGGSNDLFARAVAQKMAARLGTTVIVENKPGAGGSIGADAVARAEPDGSTLMLTSISFATNVAVRPKLPYDPIKSFAPVALVAKGGMVLVVANSTPYKTAAQLIAEGKKPNSSLNYGSAGLGSIGQMSTELMNSMAKTSSTHVPYKGISGAVTDMMGGNIQMMIATFASVGGNLKAGQIRALAVTSAERSSFAPDLPPLSEIIPGYSVEAWWGMFAPAKTPKALVDRLNAEVRTVTATPELRKVFAQEAAEPTTLSADEFGAYLNSEIMKWRKVARERDITESK